MNYSLTYIRNGKQKQVVVPPDKKETLINKVKNILDKDCTDEEQFFSLNDINGNLIMTEECLELFN